MVVSHYAFASTTLPMFARTSPLVAQAAQHGPRLTQLAAMLAIAAGIGLWGALLLAPQPSTAPPALASAPATGQNIAPVIDWFGGGSARLRVEVVGLIASGQRGAALLSINGGPAQAFRLGQTLAQGVTLSAVSSQAVSIDQDGIVEDIAVPAQAAPAPGFVPVEATR